MTIALVKSAKGASALATTTASFASATTAGNLIVLAFAADDYNGTPGAGWTQSTGMEQQTYHGGYLWWRISTGETSFQYTIGSATNSAWVIAEFSGADASSPFDVSNGQFQQSSSLNYTTPSIAPSTGNRLLCAMMGGSAGTSLSATTWGTWLNSFTAIDSIGSGGGGTNDCVGLAYRLVTGDGSTGYSSGATSTGATFQSKSGLIIAFKEAAAASNKILTAGGGSYAVTGTAASLKRGRKIAAATAGSYGFAGSTVVVRKGYKAAAGAGSYGLAGSSAALRKASRIAVLAGAYAVTGTAANLKHGRRLPSVSGSYALSGADVSFHRSYAIGAGVASYGLTGDDVSFARSYVLKPAVGAYALTGADASFTKLSSKTVIAESGSYDLSGVDAKLLEAKRISAASGSYSHTGSDASLSLAVNKQLLTDAGSYALFGQDSLIAQLRKVIAGSDIYALNGTDVSLIRTGSSDFTLDASPGVYLLSGQDIELIYTPIIGVRNPLERLKMYTGSMGSVSNREDWIVNISLVGDDGTSFDLTGANIVAYVCREGCSNSPVLSASLGDGIVLTDNYTMQWRFDEDQMASLCPQQYGVFCRVERDGITTQLLSANVAIVDGGPT